MQNIIAATLIAGAIAGVGVYHATIYQRAVENEARFQCAQSSRYSVIDASGVEVWYPVNEMYRACLSEKGIE